MSTVRVSRWKIRRWLRERWVTLRAPWPIVPECHSSHREGHRCGQCDGAHRHRWVAWRIPKGNSFRLSADRGDTAVRCRRCGARKCDIPGCSSRRHHSDPHVFGDGRVKRVGA